MTEPAGRRFTIDIGDLAERADALIAELRARSAVAWYSQPKPRRWHRCRPVVSAQDGDMTVERCACGGIRINGGPWLERNGRRTARL